MRRVLEDDAAIGEFLADRVGLREVARGLGRGTGGDALVDPGRVTTVVSRAALQEGARRLCRFVDEHRVVYTALLTGGASSHIRADFVEKTAEQSAAILNEMPLRIPGRLAVIYPLSAIVAILSWWLGEVPDTPPDEVADLIARLVFKPMVEY